MRLNPITDSFVILICVFEGSLTSVCSMGCFEEVSKLP
jgi:hypothetical protein